MDGREGGKGGPFPYASDIVTEIILNVNFIT